MNEYSGHQDIEAELADWYNSTGGKVWRASTNIAGIVVPMQAALAIATYEPGITDIEQAEKRFVASLFGYLMFPMIRDAPMYFRSKNLDLLSKIRSTFVAAYHPLLEKARSNELLRNFCIGIGTGLIAMSFPAESPPTALTAILPLSGAAIFEKERRKDISELEQRLDISSTENNLVE